MPRGRKKKVKVNVSIKPEIIKSFVAVFLLLLSGVVAVSFFADGYSINNKIQSTISGLFGAASFVVPFVLALAGILFIDVINFKYKKITVLLGMVMFLLFLSSVFHISYPNDVALDKSEAGDGGGFIGYTISQLLVQTLSIYGAGMVLVSMFVLSIILMFDVTLNQILSAISVVSKKLTGMSLPKINKHTNEEKDSEEFDVSTGYVDTPTPDEAESLLPEKDTFKVDFVTPLEEKSQPEEPHFEILPAPSEPSSSLEIKPGDISIDTSNKNLTPSLPYSDKLWETPPVDILYDAPDTPPDVGDINQRKKVIVETLRSFGINVEVRDVKIGSSVTQYSLEAEGGTRIAKITNLHSDLALALASPTGTVRIEAPIPGKSLIGIEVPNNSRAVVNFKELLLSEQMKNMKSKIGVVLGRDVAGTPKVYDISKMPHLLVAGATGSGKSVFLHSAIFSILFRANPNEVKFIMIDPKRVELVHYRDIPHLMTPVVVETDQAPSVFKWAVAEMEKRYKMFERANVRNIEGYNEKSGFQVMPYIVLICDELAEIMVADPAAVEKSIIRLGQLARATGIHLILAVQRPSTDILTGLIKANIPSRIAFNVTSQIDSRVIIDQPGAEKLLGKGDMLFVPPDVQKPVRIQGAFIRDKEIATLVTHLKGMGQPPDYNPDVFNVLSNSEKGSRSSVDGSEKPDDLYEEAYDVVVNSGKASTSYLQRRLSIGYSRAAKLLDALQAKGVVSAMSGSKGREVLVRPENPEAMMGNDEDFDNSKNDFE